MQTYNKIIVHYNSQSYEVWQDAPYSPAIAHGYTAKDDLDLKRIRDTSKHYEQILSRAERFKNYSQA